MYFSLKADREFTVPQNQKLTKLGRFILQHPLFGCHHLVQCYVSDKGVVPRFLNHYLIDYCYLDIIEKENPLRFAQFWNFPLFKAFLRQYQPWFCFLILLGSLVFLVLLIQPLGGFLYVQCYFELRTIYFGNILQTHILVWLLYWLVVQGLVEILNHRLFVILWIFIFPLALFERRTLISRLSSMASRTCSVLCACISVQCFIKCSATVPALVYQLTVLRLRLSFCTFLREQTFFMTFLIVLIICVFSSFMLSCLRTLVGWSFLYICLLPIFSSTNSFI